MMEAISLQMKRLGFPLNKLTKQILRFGVVGGTAFLIDYGLLYALTEWIGINYLISAAISFSVSVIWNYILSIKWVFTPKDNVSKLNQFTIFLVLSIIGLLLNEALMWLMVEKLAIYYMFSKVVATAVVMIYNFITRKLMIDKKEVPEEIESKKETES